MFDCMSVMYFKAGGSLSLPLMPACQSLWDLWRVRVLENFCAPRLWLGLHVRGGESVNKYIYKMGEKAKKKTQPQIQCCSATGQSVCFELSLLPRVYMYMYSTFNLRCSALKLFLGLGDGITNYICSLFRFWSFIVFIYLFEFLSLWGAGLLVF